MGMYSEVFCRVYNEFGWNCYPEAFGEQLLQWLDARGIAPRNCLDLACGTGILCRILNGRGIRARGVDLSEGMITIARENSPQIPYDVADMVTHRPGETVDLVTCTGDALNHIPALGDVARIFGNVYDCLAPGGWLVFDLLRESEVSDSEPFEMDVDDHTRVWFRMTRPEENQVRLQIRVFREGSLDFEETIRETLHDPAAVCALLERQGFRQVRCADRLLESQNKSTTWYITAKKEAP